MLKEIVYTANCHCGAVSFEFTSPKIEQVMRCDCSICLRKGIMMSAKTIPPENMKIKAKTGIVSNYQFGTMTARHHFCSICGIHTFVETRLNPGHYRINLGCVEGVNPLQLPETVYDGKSLR